MSLINLTRINFEEFKIMKLRFVILFIISISLCVLFCNRFFWHSFFKNCILIVSSCSFLSCSRTFTFAFLENEMIILKFKNIFYVHMKNNDYVDDYVNEFLSNKIDWDERSWKSWFAIVKREKKLYTRNEWLTSITFLFDNFSYIDRLFISSLSRLRIMLLYLLSCKCSIFHDTL
jgi:hypothetical protein